MTLRLSATTSARVSLSVIDPLAVIFASTAPSLVEIMKTYSMNTANVIQVLTLMDVGLPNAACCLVVSNSNKEGKTARARGSLSGLL